MQSGGLGCGGARMVGNHTRTAVLFTHATLRLHDAHADDRRDALGTLDGLDVIKQTQVHG